jgi:hypothetical protein
MKCPICGEDVFFAHQQCPMEVLVDGDGEFFDNATITPVGINAVDIYDPGTPYGPFTCYKCGAEFDELEDGAEVIDGPVEGWESKPSYAEDSADNGLFCILKQQISGLSSWANVESKCFFKRSSAREEMMRLYHEALKEHNLPDIGEADFADASFLACRRAGGFYNNKEAVVANGGKFIVYRISELEV